MLFSVYQYDKEPEALYLLEGMPYFGSSFQEFYLALFHPGSLGLWQYSTLRQEPTAKEAADLIAARNK